MAEIAEIPCPLAHRPAQVPALGPVDLHWPPAGLALPRAGAAQGAHLRSVETATLT